MRSFVERFGARAFRRPLTPVEVDEYLFGSSQLDSALDFAVDFTLALARVPYMAALAALAGRGRLLALARRPEAKTLATGLALAAGLAAAGAAASWGRRAWRAPE